MTTISRRVETYDPTTDTMVETVVTIPGSAFQKSTGSADIYQALSLTRDESPLLFFTPTNYGDVVLAGDTLPWPDTGPTFTVKSARSLAPDGVPIAWYLIVSR